MRLSLLRIVSVLGLVALFVAPGLSRAQSADEVMRRLQAKYRSVNTLRAEFTQTAASSLGGGRETVTGRLVMQGKKYRVETGSQTLVTDGVTTWVYNRSENQVLVNRAVEDETSFSLHDFLTDYTSKYQALEARGVTQDGQKYYTLRLKPKKTGTYLREATLWLRQRDNVVTRVRVLDVNENDLTFDLRNIQINPKVDAAQFRFQAPRNAEVVDLRS